MAEPAAHHIKINLNRKQKEHLENVFYKWAINGGRMLILITELVALGALFYRFVIDRQIIDLHDSIARQESFVKSQSNRELEFRSIQERLHIVKTVKEHSDLKVRIMDDIVAAIEDNTFTSSNLNIDQNTISVDGATSSIYLLEGFLERMKQYPEVLNINIGQINSTSQGLLFKMDIELKNDLQQI